MYLKYIFIFFACLLAFMISLFKLCIQKQKRTEKTSGYVSILTWSFALYILSALLLVFFTGGISNKLVITLFAISPFIIGKYATYEKEGFYSLIQIICTVISAGYVYLSLV